MTEFDSGMPTTYETQYESKTTTTTTTTEEGQRPAISFNKAYVMSIYGILKIAEALLGLIVFICAAVGDIYWGSRGGYWAEFVGMSTFVTVTIIFILYAINLAYRLWGWWLLVHFIYCVYNAAVFLITGIVAATRGIIDPSAGACAFFSFVAMAVFGVDAFFQMRHWRSGSDTYVSRVSETQTTTETTATEAQY